MIHRQPLEAAHLRIAHLEEEVAEHQATITRLKEPVVVAPPPSPKSAADSAPRATPDAAPGWLRWLALWPAVVLTVTAAIYVVKFGASLPTMDPREMIPPGRGSLASGAAGAALMVIFYALRARAGGSSSVGQRLVLLLAGLISAPFVVGCVASAAYVGSLVLGFASAAGFAVVAVIGIVRWIAVGTPDTVEAPERASPDG